MTILVIGGAGYIGSHTVQALLDQNHEVIIIDNFSTGYQDLVLSQTVYTMDIRDKDSLNKVFTNHTIDAVMHFAANSLVGESMKEPLSYYDNNVYGMQCLLEVMKNHHVKTIVFSSTAAVYGEPDAIPIIEDSLTKPTNPYGETKLTMENMMHWFEQAYGIHYVSLRYFNAAGAHPKAHIGEKHNPETHLIPLVLDVALGKRENISIFGNNYPTKDGTCIRDYIHVMDLADAHLKALELLINTHQSHIFNLGNGKGYSVLDVIQTARVVTNHPIPTTIEERRIGDPATLVASSEKAHSVLKWFPRYNLKTIIEDAWRFHQKRT